MPAGSKIFFLLSLLVAALIFYEIKVCLCSDACRLKVIKVQIIVITPTYARHTRIADLTRMANTLMHIKNLFWIIVEDGNKTVPQVQKVLDYSKINYRYLHGRESVKSKVKGWYQRDIALSFLQKNIKEITKGYDRSIVYFGDDDNAYSIRLFNEYIRKVKKIGVWAVGFAGGLLFERPNVQNGKVVGWHVSFKPRRKFATDMAGFAFNLDYLIRSSARFGTRCKEYDGVPEACIIGRLGFKLNDLEPFGFHEGPREILVWHTRTHIQNHTKRPNITDGFFVE